MITADGAVVDDDIPGPEGNGVPLFLSVLCDSPPYEARMRTNLFDLKLLLIASLGDDAVGLLGHWSVAHLDIGHVWELVICG